MKIILKVTILFCLIIACFIVPSFAISDDPISSVPLTDVLWTFNNNPYYCWTNQNSVNVYAFTVGGTNLNFSRYAIAKYDKIPGTDDDVVFWTCGYNTSDVVSTDLVNYNPTYDLYFAQNLVTGRVVLNCLNFYTFDEALAYFSPIVDANPGSGVNPSYTKNANVDEFIANTLISMGVKFDTPAYALSYASAAWDWCIDDENVESAHPFDEWSIDSFVSYCNAQSNNYLNWYNGYKVSQDVTNALGEYIRQNIRSLSGLPEGVTSLTGAYLPVYHYGSGFQSGASSPTAQTFYAAQTITYFNGEYVNETDDISTSQFLYSPADVRRFLGYPSTGSIVIPSDPEAGTGTITDDPNNPDQKNIEINFPSLGWLADAINSILDFLRNALTTLADLLTQLLDAILGLFSDAFASLADFGQGIIDFLQSVFSGLSTLLNGYVPSDLAVIIACFIALNFGIGLITFILKGH